MKDNLNGLKDDWWAAS